MALVDGAPSPSSPALFPSPSCLHPLPSSPPSPPLRFSPPPPLLSAFPLPFPCPLSTPTVGFCSLWRVHADLAVGVFWDSGLGLLGPDGSRPAGRHRWKAVVLLRAVLVTAVSFHLGMEVSTCKLPLCVRCGFPGPAPQPAPRPSPALCVQLSWDIPSQTLGLGGICAWMPTVPPRAPVLTPRASEGTCVHCTSFPHPGLSQPQSTAVSRFGGLTGPSCPPCGACCAARDLCLGDLGDLLEGPLGSSSTHSLAAWHMGVCLESRAWPPQVKTPRGAPWWLTDWSGGCCRSCCLQLWLNSRGLGLALSILEEQTPA